MVVGLTFPGNVCTRECCNDRPAVPMRRLLYEPRQDCHCICNTKMLFHDPLHHLALFVHWVVWEVWSEELWCPGLPERHTSLPGPHARTDPRLEPS